MASAAGPRRCLRPAGGTDDIPGYIEAPANALLAAGRGRQPGGQLIPVRRGQLPAGDHGVMDPAPVPYLIRIKGHLGATALCAFPGLVPRWHGAHTVLTGLLDRSALYGVLAEIDALGLDILEIRQLTPQRTPPEPGDSRAP